jgi:LPS-assembly protein
MKFLKSFHIQILLGLILLCDNARSWAQVAPSGTRPEGQEITVTADKLSAGNGANKIEASGNVEIRRQQSRLKADEVRVNRETQDVEAKGRVSLDDPEWKLKSAESVQLNLGKETGEIQKGDIFIEQGHITITGRRFQKFGGQAYHVDEAFFTTCLCESGAPSWKFSADAMDLSAEGLGTVKNSYFYIMDIPVFYLPYGFFPLRTERQTGFLFPKFGHSTREGFRFQQPFFWAISKSTDATVAFDVQSRARAGLLGEFRTKLDRESDFQLHASYFNESLRKNEQRDVVDRTIADQDIPSNRWSILGTHRYVMAADWLTYSDIAAYRDDLFARELVDRFDLPGAKEADIRRSRFGESRFGLFRSWGDAFLKGEWNFYQDFIQKDATTLQRTPQLAFWGRRLLPNFPLEFRWGAEGVNYLRRKGGDGLRLDLRPEVVLPFHAGPALFGSLSVAPRETVYHLYSPVKSSDRNISRELVEIRGNIGTALSRIYAWSGLGLSGLKHVIEPEVSYLFVPRSDQSRIPIMDDTDRVNRRNVLTFSVANRFWGKSLARLGAASSDKDVEVLNSVAGGDVRELGHLKFALSYDIDKERKGGDSLSDFDINLRFAPTNYLFLGFDGGFNPGPWQPSQVRATFTISDPRPMTRYVPDPDFSRPSSLSLSYHFLRRSPNSFLAEDANIDLDSPANCALHPADPRCPGTAFNKNTVGNVGANLLYHATDNLLLFLSSTYDSRDSRFLGVRAATKFLSFCECWSVTLGVKREINPSKTSFNFDFSLLGLGAQKSSVK